METWRLKRKTVETRQKILNLLGNRTYICGLVEGERERGDGLELEVVNFNNDTMAQTTAEIIWVFIPLAYLFDLLHPGWFFNPPFV